MAIKGKSKGRSAKAVTRGPKPVYQPVKKRLLAKREFWLVILSILGVMVVVGLVAGFIAERNSSAQDELEQRMRATMSSFQGQVDPVLTTIGQAQPPAGYQVFTDLSTAVDSLVAEKPDAPADPKALTQTATDAATSAKTALEALQSIDETALIRGKGFSEDFVLYVINAKGDFVRAMTLYGEAAKLLELAADTQGAERAELAARTKAILNAATEIFDRGYADYVEAQTKAGVFAPPAPGLPGTDRHFMTDGLLLLHAWPVDARMWEPQLAALPDGLAVAAPHLPGFGGSEPAGDVLTMGAAAERALETLGERGIDRAVVCGLSMGGYVAFELWRRARDRVIGFVLANTRAVADPPEAAAARRALAERLRSEGNLLATEPPALLSDRATEDLWARVRGWIAEQPPEAIAAASLGMAERPDSTPDIATIDVPTLVLTSTEDRMIAPEISAEMAGLIPHGRFETIEGVGHLSNLEAPEAFDAALLEHLAACGLR